MFSVVWCSKVFFITSRGLFEAARIASPVLPQYHPKQLTELLNFGRLRRVQAILAHLLACIRSAVPSSGNSDPYGDDPEDGRRSSLSRQLSLQNRRKSVVGLSPTNGLDHSVGSNTADEFQPLDYIEIDSIPPLPLFALLEADNYTGTRKETWSINRPENYIQNQSINRSTA